MPEQAEKLTKKEQALALLDERGDIGIDELHAIVGGSRNNLHRYLTQWRAARDQPRPETLRLDELNLDAGTQFRVEGVNVGWRDHLKELRESGIVLNPIGVVRTTDGFGLVPWDGFHRIDLAILEGDETIPALVRVGPLAAAMELAAGANAEDNLPRTTADKRRVVEFFLDAPAHAGLTREEIARKAGVSSRLVYKVVADRRVYQGKPEPTPAADGHPDGCPTLHRAVSDNGPTPGREPGEDDDLGAEPAGNGVAAPGIPRAGPRRSATDQADEDYLATLPLWDKLPPATGAVFARHALLYRAWEQGLRKLTRELMAHHYPREEPGAATGGFPDEVRRLLRREGPRKWVLCLRCSGMGCSDCGHRGFHLP